MGKKGTPLIHKVAFVGSMLVFLASFIPHGTSTSLNYIKLAFDGWNWGGFILLFPIIS